jgi:hypothetical protein
MSKGKAVEARVECLQNNCMTILGKLVVHMIKSIELDIVKGSGSKDELKRKQKRLQALKKINPNIRGSFAQSKKFVMTKEGGRGGASVPSGKRNLGAAASVPLGFPFLVYLHIFYIWQTNKKNED